MGFGFDIGGLLGAGISAAQADRAQRKQIEWERERATHAHQWEVQDLKAAGLNPILSSGGSGATTGGISAPQMDVSGINSAFAIKKEQEQKQQQIDNETNKTKAEVAVAESVIANNNANTARTLALTPEEEKNLQWQRAGRLRKEIGNAETEAILKGISNSAKTAGYIYGKRTSNADGKKYWKPKEQTSKPLPILHINEKKSYL